jgi:protein SCO1/2
MNSSSIKKVLILVTILAVPGFLYYLLQEKGKNRYKPLPFYGPKVVAKTFHSYHGKDIPDTIYHTIDDFKLLNQNSDTVNWESFKGKIIVLNLFYTKGGNFAVDFANKAVKAFEATYGKNRMINFVSLSIDPDNDSPEVLARYAHALPAKAGKWDLLTGDSTSIYNLIRNGLYLDALPKIENRERKFTYSNQFVLLDPQHRIRGYYDISRQEALSKLDDEIKVLITEELRMITAKDGR